MFYKFGAVISFVSQKMNIIMTYAFAFILAKWQYGKKKKKKTIRH